MLTRALVSLLVASTLAWPAAGAPDSGGRDDIHGLWVERKPGDKQKVAVWIEDCNGLLCGRVYWLKKPLTASGAPKRDPHNPDAALRERPLCGLTILSGFRRVKEKSWGSGHIYNPGDGRTFSSTINLEQDGSLRIRGYVGIPLFGKTVEWVRPQGNLAPCN